MGVGGVGNDTDAYRCDETERERDKQRERERKTRTFGPNPTHARLLRLLAHSELVLPVLVRHARGLRIFVVQPDVRQRGLSRGVYGFEKDACVFCVCVSKSSRKVEWI